MANPAPRDLFSRLYIQNITGAESEVRAPFSFRPLILPFTVISSIIPIEGIPCDGSHYEFDDGNFSQKIGDCWVIPPNTRHFSHCRDSGHKSIWTHINFRLEPDWDILHFFKVPHVFSGEDARVLRECCQILNQGEKRLWAGGKDQVIVPREKPSFSTLCQCRIAEYRIFETILKNSTPLHDLEKLEIAYLNLLPVLDYIQKNLHKKITLKELAQIFCYSQSALEKKFYSGFGISPGHFILESRLHQSAQLLKNSTMSCAEIAESTGFYDQFAFSKAFKKKYRITPIRYRYQNNET